MGDQAAAESSVVEHSPVVSQPRSACRAAMEQEEKLREESARQREVYRETIAQERGLSTSLQEQLRQASEQISKLRQENGEMRAHVDATSGALLEAMAQEERVKEESAQQLAFAHERVEQEGAFVAALQEQLRS